MGMIAIAVFGTFKSTLLASTLSDRSNLLCPTKMVRDVHPTSVEVPAVSNRMHGQCATVKDSRQAKHALGCPAGKMA